MSIDELAKYRGKEEYTFKSDTPISLLGKYIPKDVINFYTHIDRDNLGDVYYGLRDIWECLKENGSLAESMLDEVGLTQNSLNKLIVEVTQLLESDYLKQELLIRYKCPRGVKKQKDKSHWSTI